MKKTVLISDVQVVIEELRKVADAEQTNIQQCNYRNDRTSAEYHSGVRLGILNSCLSLERSLHI